MITESRPTQKFSPYVDRYWSTKITPEAAGRPYEVYPDANVDLLFELSGSGCRIVLYGPLTRAMFIRTEGGCDYFGVRFKPGACPRLEGFEASELADASVELHGFLGTDVQALGTRLRDRPTADARQLVIEDLLSSPGADPFKRNALVDEALRLIRASAGRVTVKRAAAHLGVSTRTLERSFLSQVGVSPKTFIRLTRFDRARAALACPRRGLAEIASACGYADQSHLIKDFKALSGKLPSEF